MGWEMGLEPTTVSYTHLDVYKRQILLFRYHQQAHSAIGRQLPCQPRPVFVSRMPRRKVTGPGHKETIKGAAAADEGLLTVRKALTCLLYTSA